MISHQSECAKTEQPSIWGLLGFFAYFSVKRNVIKSQLWVYVFFSKVFPMIGNVTKVTLIFFLEKLDDIPCIIFFLTHDRIVLNVALSHLSFPKRKFTSCNSLRFCALTQERQYLQLFHRLQSQIARVCWPNVPKLVGRLGDRCGWVSGVGPTLH